MYSIQKQAANKPSKLMIKTPIAIKTTIKVTNHKNHESQYLTKDIK